MSRKRLDAELVERGLVPDIAAARLAIENKSVIVSGSGVVSEKTLVARDQPIVITQQRRFASRGGDKLEGALDDFAIDVSGKRCLDAGAGSGGFTDCLLKRGAASVLAVDVGYGQFDWNLRTDARVALLERTNIRSIDPAEHGLFDLIVADLSFVSLESIAPHLMPLSEPDGEVVALVKPQFEAGEGEVPDGGVVLDPTVWRKALERALSAFLACGGTPLAVVASQLRGTEGNQEFFVHIASTSERPIASYEHLIQGAIDRVHA